jgi:hypothetical protein
MYRDDDAARAARANALIDELAELERRKISQAATDHRLETVKRELSALQSRSHAPAVPERSPGLLAHVVVFGATAVAAALGYSALL